MNSSERPEVEGGLCRHAALTALAGSLSIALLDAVLALAVEPHRVSSAVEIAAPMALLALLATIPLAAAAYLIGRLADRGRAASAFSMSIGAILLFGLLWVSDLNRISPWRDAPLSALLRTGVVSIGALLASIGVLRFSRDLRLRFDAVLRLQLFIVLSLAMLLCVELTSESSLDSVVRTGSRGIICVVALTLLVAGLIGASRAEPVWLERALVLGFGATLASPFLPIFEARVAPPTPLVPHERSQVVLISVDTLRRDALTCFDPRGAGTPHIDQLAADGSRFSAAFSSGPWTIPAFVSLMTGLPADVHGVNHDFATIPDRFRTLAERLREIGYRTAAIGNHPQLLRVNRGFDDFDFTPRRLPYHRLMTGTKLLWRLLDEVYTTDDIPRVAGAWLEEHSRYPFFLWIHFLDPHGPYEPPVRFLAPSHLVEEFGSSSSAVRVDRVRSGRQIRSADERKWLRLLYEGEVQWVDEAIGSVINHLRRLDLYDDTLVILVADHGEEFWEHGTWEHGHSLYDELVRVPLIVKLPGERSRGVIDEPVSTAALLPTILELIGKPPPGDPMMPESFAHLFHDERNTNLERPVFLGGLEYFEPREGVVVGGFKYIRSLVSDNAELYDLARDGAERRSLVVERPDIVALAQGLLQRRSGKVQTPPPPPVDRSRDDDPPVDANVESQLRDLGYLE